MSKILELYSALFEATKREDRFIAETFVDEVYKDCRPQLTIVDLGAFTGEFSFYCLPFAKHIFAVEPDPVPFAKLKEYVETFQIPNVSIFPIAIGNKNGKRKMRLTHGGGSYFDDGEAPEIKEVETLTLATFMNQNKIDHIDILKVDVEGAESEIFGPSFKKLVPKIDLVIGEHNGFELLKKYGFKLENKPSGVYLAKK